MTPLVYTAAQVVAMFPPELGVTEYWVSATARRHKIGTIIRRKRSFTLPQIEKLIALQADEATQQPRPSRKTTATKADKARTPKAKPLPPAPSTVTELRARPERARSYPSAS